MKIEFTPFAFTDLLSLDLQPAHQRLLDPIMARMIPLKALMESPYSWSGWTSYGRLAACAGIMPDGRAWALFSGNLKREFVPISRKARAMMEAFPGPVVADIDEASPEAVRWAKLVGFKSGPTAGAWLFQRPEGTALCSNSVTP